MEIKQLDYFRRTLTDRLDELLSQAEKTVFELRGQNTREIEHLDQASINSEQTFKLRMRTRESRLIKKVKNALERIENDTYGICELCGEDISFKRLEARPVTTKCISCKEEEELTELRIE
jgi:DnaK suppressor protein